MHSVMLVDDEVYARQGLRKLIDWEAYGFEVIAESDDGEDALAFIDHHQPDLVITDIRMPVLDGLELIRKCTHNQPSPPAFIIVSGYDDFKYAQQAVRFGVHDFILKPIDEHILQSTLQELNELITKKKEDDLARKRESHKEMITAIIKGELNKPAALSVAQKLGLQGDGDIYYVLVEMNDQHPWQEQQMLRQLELNEHIDATLNSLLGEQSEWNLIEHRNQVGILLPEQKLSNIEDIKSFTATLHQALIKRLQGTVYIYVGLPVSDMTQLQQAYLTAKEAGKFKFIKQPRILVTLVMRGSITAVWQWNSWFDVFLYNSSNIKLSTLQYELMKILQNSNTAMTSRTAAEHGGGSFVTPTSIRATMTIIVSVPIICVYPFLQKYFVKGMTLGGVKG